MCLFLRNVQIIEVSYFGRIFLNVSFEIKPDFACFVFQVCTFTPVHHSSSI
jgi:hypothetical protein